MGSFAGWRCKSCGAHEEFSCGGGMMGLNNPAVVEQARKGELGPAMKALLADGIPEGWMLFEERAYYRCPECDGAIEGTTVRIDDRSGNWLVYHLEPPACAKCGEKLMFWDDKVPMSFDALLARCKSYAENGCPTCRSKDVELDLGNWD